MIFVDSNIFIDVFGRDPRWFEWSSARLSEAAADDGAVIDVMIVAELSSTHASLAALHERLSFMSVQIVPLELDVAYQAGKLFADWRRNRALGSERRLLADFLIGAHAAALNAPLLTRDPSLYRRYFPDLPLITPETHPHG